MNDVVGAIAPTNGVLATVAFWRYLGGVTKKKPTEKLFAPVVPSTPKGSAYATGGPTLIDEEPDTFQVLDHEVVAIELDGVAVVDMLGQIQHANVTFAEMHKSPVKELLGRSLDSLHTSAQRSDARVFYDEARRHGLHEGKLRRERKGGEVFPSWTSASMIQDAGGDPEGLLLVVRDLSKGEKTTTEGNRWFVDAIPDGYALCEVIVDAVQQPTDCRVLEVNPAFEALLGQSATQIVGRTILELLPDTKRSWVDACGSVAKTGAAVRIESFSEALDVPLEVLVFRPRPGQVACLFQNITERSAAHEPGPQEIVQTVAELRGLVERLMMQVEDSRASLAAVLRDKLRQNLAVLGMKLGMTQAFADQGDTKKIVGIVDHAIGQIGDMGDTVRTLLRSLRPRKLDDEGLFAALSWYAERTSKNTPLLVLLEGAPCQHRLPVATELALFRITEDAVDNVKQHSGATRAHVRLEPYGDRVVLTITDDGSGFDVGGARPFGKAGGLVAIRERALSMGGTFELGSTKGGGTRIMVTVPIQSR